VNVDAIGFFCALASNLPAKSSKNLAATEQLKPADGLGSLKLS